MCDQRLVINSEGASITHIGHANIYTYYNNVSLANIDAQVHISICYFLVIP